MCWAARTLVSSYSAMDGKRLVDVDRNEVVISSSSTRSKRRVGL